MLRRLGESRRPWDSCNPRNLVLTVKIIEDELREEEEEELVVLVEVLQIVLKVVCSHLSIYPTQQIDRMSDDGLSYDENRFQGVERLLRCSLIFLWRKWVTTWLKCDGIQRLFTIQRWSKGWYLGCVNSARG